MKATTLVNGDRYRAMITNFFIPELNNHDVQELWFQKDGATCHTARATIDLLKDTFGDSLISRFGPVNWPPRSCDLTPLDYFLWGYVKSLVYADKPQTFDHLEDKISRVISDIRPQMLEKVIKNWTSKLDYIRTSRCSPMPEIIFKILSEAIKSFVLVHNYSPLIQWTLISIENDGFPEERDPGQRQELFQRNDEYDHTERYLTANFGNALQLSADSGWNRWNLQQRHLLRDTRLSDLQINNADFLNSVHASGWRRVFKDNLIDFSCTDTDIAGYVK
ncbi:uncharacterized protein TNCV_3706211 [Trichonephila clavipes]|nr:uncharacterized protein TNCV_3706211 [Trichonephila clavipes]